MPIQPRAEATRQKIIDTAVRLFAANGYLETSPHDIAAAADLTTGAFYYHFTSKEALADEIIDQGWPKVAAALGRYAQAPGSGLKNVIEAAFAIVEILNRDQLQWIGFHLNMAIGHLNPSARRSYRERVEAFSLVVPGAFRDCELRDGVTRRQAGELLWIALSGAQLMSDVLGSTAPASFARLGMAWKAALRTIVPDQELPRLFEFIDDLAARYGLVNAAEPVAVADHVA